MFAKDSKLERRDRWGIMAGCISAHPSTMSFASERRTMASNPKKPPASKAPPPASGPKAGKDPVKKSIPESPAPRRPRRRPRRRFRIGKTSRTCPRACRTSRRRPGPAATARPIGGDSPLKAELPPPTMHTKAQVDLSPVAAAPTPTVPTPTPPQPRPQGPSQPPLLFEIAWEVCWQLGGIYTVLQDQGRRHARALGRPLLPDRPVQPRDGAPSSSRSSRPTARSARRSSGCATRASPVTSAAG